jgi:CheY-like chemotaxis protein
MLDAQARILVVEDNADNMMLIAYLLRAHGFFPELAYSGEAGLELAALHRPQLILLDILMPGMDGYEVATAVRGRAELAETRIVAVTASAMVGDRERIVAAGFDGYIQKPIDPERFIGEVRRFLPSELAHEAAGA